MKNLTTPQAILCGFALIALAIASIPYSLNIVSPAQAYADEVSKVAICSPDKITFSPSGLELIYNGTVFGTPFTFSFYTDPRDSSKIRCISFPNCSVRNNRTNATHIHFECAPDLKYSM